MKREFKFRGYSDGLFGQGMHYGWGCFIDSPGKVYLLQDNDRIRLDALMQYTGLKDKNGKDIYEGDIVRILYTDWMSKHLGTPEQQAMSLEEYKKSISKKGEVVFAGDRYSIDFHDGYGTGSMFEGSHGEKEIIGNIFENPELLDAAQIVR